MPIICSALKRGQRVRMTVTGSSMLPFIYDGDVVELEHIPTFPKMVDIVLVQCSEERYVMHRVVRVEGDTIFLRGDAQLNCEGSFTLQNILGRVTWSFHNGFARTHNRGIWRLTALLWTRIFPMGLILFLLVGRIRRIGRRVLRGLNRIITIRISMK